MSELAARLVDHVLRHVPIRPWVFTVPVSVYPRRRPWSDGSTARRLDPLERLERLAALVPAPRRPLLAYHGLLAPYAAWRAALVRAPAPGDVRRARVAGDPAPPDAPGRWSWARLFRRVVVCRRCAGPRRIRGAVTEPHAVQRLLGVLGLAAQPPPRLPVSAHT